MVITDRTPEAAAIERKTRLVGIRRRIAQEAPYQSESRNRSVPRPTITSQARWTTLTSDVVGRSAAGTLSRPLTTVFLPVLGSDSHEASPGIGIPPLTVSLEFRRPSSLSGTSLEVWGTSSIAANFSGCSLYTHRANASPTPIWIGVATAATVKAIVNASRW